MGLFCFLFGTICCDPSFEQSQRDGRTRGPNMFIFYFIFFNEKLTKIISNCQQVLHLIWSSGSTVPVLKMVVK